MNRKYFLYFFIAVTFIIVFFLGRSCSGSPKIVKTNAEVKTVLKEERVIAKMKETAFIQHDTILKERHHYHTIRRDSLIPCETKLVICDTILVHDSIHDITQDLIIARQDIVIVEWHVIHSQDSTSILSLKKEVRKQKWQKRVIIALWVLREGVGLINK